MTIVSMGACLVEKKAKTRVNRFHASMFSMTVQRRRRNRLSLVVKKIYYSFHYKILICRERDRGIRGYQSSRSLEEKKTTR